MYLRTNLSCDLPMALVNPTPLPHKPHFVTATSTNFKSYNLNLPPNFKYRHPTATSVSFTEKPSPNDAKTQQPFAPATLGNAPNPGFRREKSDQIDYCISLLQHRVLAKSNAPDARQVHAQIIKSGVFDSCSSNLIRNKLVVYYAKASGLAADARRVFDAIPDRSVPAYAALIGAYGRSVRWADVISVFGLMVCDGVEPDKFLVPTILKACGALEDLGVGTMVHAFVIRRMMEVDVVIGNSLIDMYAKCGKLEFSQSVFYLMEERDVVSWTVLVSAYADVGLLDEAMDNFESMQMNGVKPDLISWNALISGFAQNGDIGMAHRLLEEMQEKGSKPEIGSWNGLISGCVQSGCFEDSLDLFCKMCSSYKPNAVSIVSVLSACSGLQALNFGRELHSYAIKHELFKSNLFVGGSLIDMYSKCQRSDYGERVFGQMESKNTALCNNMLAAYVNEGKMTEALEFVHFMRANGLKLDLITYNTMLAGFARKGQKDEAYKVFSEMNHLGLKPNIVSLNALISGFQQQGIGRDALNLFRMMQFPNEFVMNNVDNGKKLVVEIVEKPIHPNAITIASALSSCSDLNLIRQGKEIHAYILRNYFECNVVISGALVDMYSKCLAMDLAVKVFHRITDKNTITWNILMAGYNHNKEPKTALKLFPLMLEDGCIPTLITFTILASACSTIAAFMLGRQLHGYIEKCGFEESTSTLASALIDMYAKCGSILEARLVFDTTSQKDVVVWNVMISGYSIHGMAKDAIRLLEQLEASGTKPDHITFTSVLSACAHEGSVEEGWKYFKSMKDVYGIEPTLEHCTCMVGIMGGAGLLKDALDFMRRMPCEPDACMWATLLHACRVQSNSDIGEKAANALFELEPNNASNYIALSNIYGMSGMWDAARNIRTAMRARGLNMVPSCSWIEVGSTIHAFKAGDKSHPELENIRETWWTLAQKLEQEGHSPHDIVFPDEQDINPFSCFHTEKLAICFGIISCLPYSPIRVSKNVRMCIDCHTSTKLLSKICCREIFVRDGCFYHYFKDGKCSCKDKW